MPPEGVRSAELAPAVRDRRGGGGAGARTRGEVSPLRAPHADRDLVCGQSTRTSWTFVRLGNGGGARSAARAQELERSGSRRRTACGFPTDTAVGSTRAPSTSSDLGRRRRRAPAPSPPAARRACARRPGGHRPRSAPRRRRRAWRAGGGIAAPFVKLGSQAVGVPDHDLGLAPSTERISRIRRRRSR
jgi:hypothetical protein